ncbi:MAG: hypothetical protein IJS65_08805, partial [Clostridia bacterium]|nr:hypothetical protein [Clostridia bacterium]
MKKLSLILALLVVFTALSPAAFAVDTYYYRTDIANGSPLRITYAQTDGSYLRYYQLDGGADSRLKPIVVFGDKLYGTLSIWSALSKVEEQGYYPMAAFNSDFFSMSTGVPTGMNVIEGRLCSSGAEWNCLAFNADGTAFCGEPKLEITVSIGDHTYPLSGINKMRTAGGIYLFTEDFADSTKTVYEGCEVVLSSVNARQLSINKPLQLFVNSVADATDTPIPKGGFVLSVTKNTEEYYNILKG